MRSPYGRTGLGEAIERLAESALAGHLCPVVGAGASCDLGAPDWRSLVRELVGSVWTMDAKQRAALESQDPSVLSEFVAHAVDSQEQKGEQASADGLGKALAKSLYANVPPDWTAGPLFEASAVRCLAEMAIHTSIGSPARGFHLITYNFDTFLEEAISALGYPALMVIDENVLLQEPRRSAQPFHGLGRWDRPVVVAHPHGLVTRGGDVYPPIVFTAEQYEQRLSAPLSRPSVRQLLAFGSCSCLFYGLSFRDYAIRYLLSAAAMQTASYPHVAILYDELPPVLRRSCEKAFARRNILPIQMRDYEGMKRILRVLATEVRFRQQA